MVIGSYYSPSAFSPSHFSLLSLLSLLSVLCTLVCTLHSLLSALSTLYCLLSVLYTLSTLYSLFSISFTFYHLHYLLSPFPLPSTLYTLYSVYVLNFLLSITSTPSTRALPLWHSGETYAALLRATPLNMQNERYKIAGGINYIEYSVILPHLHKFMDLLTPMLWAQNPYTNSRFSVYFPLSTLFKTTLLQYPLYPLFSTILATGSSLRCLPLPRHRVTLTPLLSFPEQSERSSVLRGIPVICPTLVR